MTNLNQNLKAIIIVLAGAVIALALVAAGLAKTNTNQAAQEDTEFAKFIEAQSEKASMECRKAIENHGKQKETYGFLNEDMEVTHNPEMTNDSVEGETLHTYTSKGKVLLKYLGDSEVAVPYTCLVTIHQDGKVAGVLYDIN